MAAAVFRPEILAPPSPIRNAARRPTRPCAVGLTLLERVVNAFGHVVGGRRVACSQRFVALTVAGRRRPRAASLPASEPLPPA